MVQQVHAVRHASQRQYGIKLPRGRLAAFCRRWRVSELALFGSVLRGDFAMNSDVDVLVSFADGVRWSLFDMVDMQNDLREMLGREVDLVPRRSVEESENYIRRKSILSTAEVIYAAR